MDPGDERAATAGAEAESSRARALPRTTTVLLGLAGAVVAAAGLRAVSSLAGPVLLALVLVLAFVPLDRRLRRHLPGWVAVLVTTLCVYGVLIVFTGALVLAVARLVTLLAGYGPRFSLLLQRTADWLTGFGITRQQIAGAAGGLDPTRLIPVLQSVVNGAGGVAAAMALLASVLYFLVVDAAPFSRALEAVAPGRPLVVAALTDFAARTRQWLIAAAVFGLVVALLDTAALLVLGVPLPLLWGLLSFLANFIPNIGFVLALVPPALLALLNGNPGQAVAVVVVFVVISTIVQTGIQPRVVGNAVGLAGSLTFVSVVFWGLVLGPLGALLAVPLSLLVKALLVDADPRLHWLRPLLAADPSEEGGVPAPLPRRRRRAEGDSASGPR
jgi:predicted PurR-regulated permease PerM